MSWRSKHTCNCAIQRLPKVVLLTSAGATNKRSFLIIRVLGVRSCFCPHVFQAGQTGLFWHSDEHLDLTQKNSMIFTHQYRNTNAFTSTQERNTNILFLLITTLLFNVLIWFVQRFLHWKLQFCVMSYESNSTTCLLLTRENIQNMCTQFRTTPWTQHWNNSEINCTMLPSLSFTVRFLLFI